MKVVAPDVERPVGGPGKVLMRGLIVLAVLVATSGCEKGVVIHGEADAAPAMPARQAGKLAPGEWEITTLTVPRPGAPGAPESTTGTTILSEEEAVDPPPSFFGACRTGALDMSGGQVRGSMPCHGDGALSNASVSVIGSYSRTSFQVTVDTRFMGMTLRQEIRGRHLRDL